MTPETHPDMFYGEYCLAELPNQARPAKDRVRKGKHSYTVYRGKGQIEVLLRTRAFFVRGPNQGQVSWLKNGGIKCLDLSFKRLFYFTLFPMVESNLETVLVYSSQGQSI